MLYLPGHQALTKHISWLSRGTAELRTDAAIPRHCLWGAVCYTVMNWTLPLKKKCTAPVALATMLCSERLLVDCFSKGTKYMIFRVDSSGDNIVIKEFLSRCKAISFFLFFVFFPLQDLCGNVTKILHLVMVALTCKGVNCTISL